MLHFRIATPFVVLGIRLRGEDVVISHLARVVVVVVLPSMLVVAIAWRPARLEEVAPIQPVRQQFPSSSLSRCTGVWCA